MQDDLGVAPDTKDWTWVLEQPCPECGFDAAAVARADIAAMARDNAAAWVRVLDRPGVRERPVPAVWSPLEYACHVRDVHRVFGQRVARMLAEDDPVFASWDQDRAAIEGRYDEEDPGTVGRDVAGAAAEVSARFDTVAGNQWHRPGRRSNGSVFTVESLGRYYAHDWVHHLHDVGGDGPS